MNNSVKTLSDNAATLAHDAAQTAEHSMRSMQRATEQGLDRMADELDDARAQTSSALRRLSREADSLRHRGMDAVRERSHQLREKSTHVRDATTTYIQHEPLKSMLLAAAVGAAVVGLVVLFSQRDDSRR